MYENEFLEATREKGFNIGEVIADGTYKRFDIRKKGDKVGYYNLDPHTGNGVYGDNKTKDQFLFRAGHVQQMNDEERHKHDTKIKEQMRLRRKEVANKQNQAAIEVNKIWDESVNAAEGQHDYLNKKSIKPHGTRLDKSGALLIPIYENDIIVNVQRIYPNGKKLFHPGARKKGCYGLISGETDVIFIAEGFATAASINEATGKLCVVALDSGNLLPVSKTIRDKYGVDVEIIIAGDNDQWSEKNVGKEAAEQSALAIVAPVKLPDFPPDDPNKLTDWNDYAIACGIEALRDSLLPEKKTAESREVAEFKKSRQDPLDLEQDSNGRPIASIDNLREVCRYHRIVLRYNVIKKQEEIIVPDESFSLDNSLNASFARVLSFCKEHDLSTACVKEYLTYLTDKNLYNPIATWITSKPWDGTSRQEDFYATIDSPDDELKCVILYRWMISAIAAAFNPNGVSAHGVLVFRGEQYLGKTSWFKRLVPQELDATKDGYILRLDNKDSVFQCLSHWIVELGELEATFKKSDIAQLKAFLTADKDILRRPYAAKESYYARRTVFFASVNQKEFLFDETGNRRFWTIETTKINYNHDLDMQQVWAEFYELYKSGQGWVMSAKEIGYINVNNQEFMGADYYDEMVERYFDWDKIDNGVWKTVTQVCQMLDVQNPKQGDLNKISKALRKYNGNKTKRGTGGNRELLVPTTLRSGEDYEFKEARMEFG